MPGADDNRANSPLFATFMLVLLCLIWGLTFPATKAAVETTDAVHFLAIRFTLGFFILLALYHLPHRRRRRRATLVQPPPLGTPLESGPHGGVAPFQHPLWARLRQGRFRGVLLRGVIVGLFLFAGFLLQVKGLEHTTASRSGFFTGLLVVLVPPIALTLRTSRSPLLSWFAPLPALAGIFLMADPSSGGLNLGDLLTIGCALGFALQMVVLEGLSGGDRETEVLVLGQVGTGAVLAIGWSLLAGKPFALDLTGAAAAAYTALFGTVLAVWMQTRYQPRVPAGHAALIFMLEPVFAAAFAWVLMGDGWTLRTASGALFILLAMGISSLAVSRYDRRPRSS